MRNMKQMRNIMAIALLGFSLSTYADLKVGVVNLQTVFEQAPQGQATVKRLEDTLAPQMESLKVEQTSLNNAMAAFNRNAPTLSANERATQEQKLSDQQQQFQQKVDTLKAQEAQKQQAAASTFQADLVNAIGQVAKSGSYDMVMTDQAVPYYNSGFDVSTQVVALMSKMDDASGGNH
jgi:outer membrane protein